MILPVQDKQNYLTKHCYIFKIESVLRYESCITSSCKCGSTGLKYFGVGENVGKSVPSNLDYLRDDKEGKKFEKLIPFWNDNKPCDKRKNRIRIL